MLIGVPVKNDHETFEAMLNSLVDSTSFYSKIIVVESDNDLDYWESIKQRYFGVEVIHGNYKTPLEAYNRLFQIAKERNDDLLLTQTDVLFPNLYKRDWLRMMYEVSQNPEIGIVVPIGGGGISGPDYIDGFRWVGGWCTFCSKKIWKIFDKYDENYAMGYGVDIDMTYAVSQHFKIVQVNYWVDHHMMNERLHDNNPDCEKAKKEAAKYFKSKWKLNKGMGTLQ